MLSAKDLAKYFDHTLLDPSATAAQIHLLCSEAKDWGFYSVCVHPYYLELCKQELLGTPVKLCTVVGFPLGQNTVETKIYETKNAIQLGADEIDMVLNISALKSQRLDYVQKEIESVVNAADNKTVKVIIETALLNKEQIIKATHLCENAKAHYVKTSTGFSKRGASLEDIETIVQATSTGIKIKASGGIRNLEDAQKFINAGVHRLGASKSVDIVKSLI
ncbi:MAG: deoxyribose-phosphate aldolase [Bdellovibrionales bacterium]|nr:deoxyribose-phosphate aldolase [Bdellovibrionales bacterium]